MNARSFASRAAMEAQKSSLISSSARREPGAPVPSRSRGSHRHSEYPVLLADRHGLQTLQHLEKALDGGPERLELRVGPGEPAEGGHAPQALDVYFHGREHTTRMRSHGRRADRPPRSRRRRVAPDP